MSADPFDLERFAAAQGGSYAGALAELRAGRKTGHWMWFVFPQLVGLGRSPMAERYGISGLDESRAYLAHPVLRERLLDCCEALLLHADRSASSILGSPDDMKLRSSMTLFHRADPSEPAFRRILDTFYGGVPDPRTDELLR